MYGIYLCIVSEIRCWRLRCKITSERPLCRELHLFAIVSGGNVDVNVICRGRLSQRAIEQWSIHDKPQHFLPTSKKATKRDCSISSCFLMQQHDQWLTGVCIIGGLPDSIGICLTNTLLIHYWPPDCQAQSKPNLLWSNCFRNIKLHVK